MQQYTTFDKIKAMSVHLFTSSGLIAGFMALLALAQNNFTAATLWMVLTLIIDGIDGTFARLFKVKQVLPNFNGTMIDYVVDFFTYAILPAYFFYQAHLLPPQLELVGVCMVLLVSAIYYGKDGMVSDNYHFVGFPVMWNVVVWYLYFVTQTNVWINFVAVVVFSILHFVPIKYPYPSRTLQFRGLNIAATVLCITSTVMCAWQYPNFTYWNYLALLSVAYYGFISVYYTYTHR
jgi:phosphatidylcholine synthase